MRRERARERERERKRRGGDWREGLRAARASASDWDQRSSSNPLSAAKSRAVSSGRPALILMLFCPPSSSPVTLSPPRTAGCSQGESGGREAVRERGRRRQTTHHRTARRARRARRATRARREGRERVGVGPGAGRPGCRSSARGRPWSGGRGEALPRPRPPRRRGQSWRRWGVGG
eukprot:824138-Rhodomonas_salina.1